MDIPGLSIALSQIQIQSDVGMAILDKNLQVGEELGEGMVQMLDSAAMERSVTPHIGGNIDVSV